VILGCRLPVAGSLLLLFACRTVSGPALSPLRAKSPEEALIQLRARVENFSGARSLMRVRVMTPEKTQSFRAQLVIPDRNTTDVIVYTPVGTTAGAIHGSGDQLTLDGGEPPPPEIHRLFANRKPAEMAMVLIGLPAVSDAVYDATPAGLRRAVVGDTVVEFEPPQFPPRRVVVRRGSDVLEIEHVELVAMR
jgi:hypothetical protein